VKGYALRVLVIFAVLAVCAPFVVREEAGAWGFYAHKRINRMACYTLPPELFHFYKRHIDFVSDHAVDADRRRYASPWEAPRHYIDIDHYAAPGVDPFTVVPREWDAAVAKFTEDTLQAYGIVPWHIQHMHARLVKAFRRLDLDAILVNSADIGHYIADAHVPLHTTENYNGQLTNQHGIHAFWESRIPELSAEDYDHFTGRARYLDRPLDEAWSAVMASNAAVDSVLGIERTVSEQWPDDQQFSYVQRGASTVRAQSREYTLAYEQAMAGMVERRMNAAIYMVGSYWYTAWVDAGQPDLRQLEDKAVSDSLRKVMQAEDEQLRMATKSIGREEPNE
jgi:hypothetical protein